ncbi:MAG: ArsR/SmtB family transcription factor [Tangfeifania sp.]
MNSSEKYNETFTALAAALQALSHPARLQVVEHLAKYNDCPAGAISKELPLSKSTVSQHMAKLRKAGLITCYPNGVCQSYRLNTDKLNEVIQLVESFGLHVNSLAELKTTCKQSVNKIHVKELENYQVAE